MTLVVAAYRTRDFVICGSDRSQAWAPAGGTLSDIQPDPDPAPLASKARQVSDRVLACGVGDVVRSEHFHALMSERVGRGDDVQACFSAMFSAFAEVGDDPVPYWVFPDGSRRLNGADFGMPFGVQVAGFHANGDAYMANVMFTQDGELEMIDYAGREVAMSCALPLFAEAEDGNEQIGHLEPAEFDIRAAVDHILRIHRHFRDKHERLISETFDLTMLRWRGENVAPAAARLTVGAEFLDAVDLMVDVTHAAAPILENV